MINKVTQEDALKLGVSESEALGIFRIDDGKVNLAPPAEKALYSMVGVQLPTRNMWVAYRLKCPTCSTA